MAGEGGGLSVNVARSETHWRIFIIEADESVSQALWQLMACCMLHVLHVAWLRLKLQHTCLFIAGYSKHKPERGLWGRILQTVPLNALNIIAIYECPYVCRQGKGGRLSCNLHEANSCSCKNSRGDSLSHLCAMPIFILPESMQRKL